MNNLTLRDTIKSKSDQLNVDDLAGQPKMIQVEAINIVNDPQQPVHIYYAGGNNIPYKPCLTVRRILVGLWGDDDSLWIGRYMNLYVDPDVDYGKQKGIGGIRVNAMSHIPDRAKIKLTARRGIKKEYTIEVIQLNG